MLRASGVAYDIRRAAPYGIYDRFDFDVITGTNGDLYDRYYVRLLEMRESVKILKQAVRDIPDGPILPGKKSYQIKVPAGEAYSRVENPKGELGYYVVADGSADGLPLPRPQPELHQPDGARADVPGPHRSPTSSASWAASISCWARWIADDRRFNSYAAFSRHLRL